jgi:tetratricopeptide (TPR) repeat protein
MGRLILCYSKKAEKPYYIRNMNINLYTIEELCYYLYHNIYLLDENVINDELIRWIEEELELTDLSEILNVNRGNIKNLTMSIFQYTGYISSDDIEETDKLLTRIDGQSDVEKKMDRAKHLLNSKKYVVAILEYQSLTDIEDENQKEKILNNMGVAYANLFLFRDAAKCFAHAYEINRNQEIYNQFLYAIALASKEEIADIAKDISEDYEQILNTELNNRLSAETNDKLKEFHNVLNYKDENQISMYYKGLKKLLEDWKKEYINFTI